MTFQRSTKVTGSGSNKDKDVPKRVLKVLLTICSQEGG